MPSRSPISVILSPPGAPTPLPASNTCSTPTKLTPPGAAVQYRIEERRRTVYVTSDVPPSEWGKETMKGIFRLADISEAEPQDTPSVRRAKSLSEREFVVFEDKDVPAESSPQYSYRPASRSEVTLQVPSVAPPTPPNTPSRSSRPASRHRILFYHKHDPHYGFTNFSSHPVVYKGKRYPTSEHLFQSFKFQDYRPNLAEHIRTCSERPSVAFSEARRFQPEVRPDWKQVNVEKMDVTLWHKFTQNLDLKAELLATGDAELVEDSDKDAFWGVGADRRGRNELGKALERLRAKLREA